MFRKLVSNLPFSPALVGQLGFYARRLKKEELTRRLGLIVTALALVMQSFAVFSPPESANAANASDMIHGGVDNKSQILEAYDRSSKGNGDLKDILDYAGITRDELSDVKKETINSREYGKDSDAWVTFGRVHRFSSSQGEVKHVIPHASDNDSTTLYSRPLWRYDSHEWSIKNGTPYVAFVGHSKKIGMFAILKNCGNLTVRKTPKPVPVGSFIEATCDVVKGSAVDARNTKENVRIYLYFNGPPGKGDTIGPLSTHTNDHTFSYTVPEKYRKSVSPTRVWGVLIPLTGWNDTSVQFKDTITIPGNCIKEAPKPTAVCTNLQNRIIDRTKFSLIARASASNGAKINSYTFTVIDKTGKVVETKTITSNANQVDSGIITVATPGVYMTNVAVNTSVGTQSSPQCASTLTIATPEMCTFNPDIPKNSTDCKPCPDNSQIWYNNPACKPQIVQSKEAKNLTKNADASSIIAAASDRIEYTIYVENVGEVPAMAAIDEELTDVMEYASLEQSGGGAYNADSHMLSWSNVQLQPGEKTSRTFVVKVNDTIPTTAQGISEPGSYDCIMTNAFGNTVTIKVNCEAPKMVEQTVSELPKTGPGLNVLFAGALAAVVTYFWARSKQIGKEVRLIRREFNQGTI